MHLDRHGNGIDLAIVPQEDVSWKACFHFQAWFNVYQTRRLLDLGRFPRSQRHPEMSAMPR